MICISKKAIEKLGESRREHESSFRVFISGIG
jgi:hypothetical protein